MSAIAPPPPKHLTFRASRNAKMQACASFVRPLHYFRCGLSLLPREEPLRADSSRSTSDADLLHHLPAVEQPDHPLRGEIPAQRQSGCFLGLWFLTIVLGGLFLFGTGQEWHRLIYEHGLTISTNLFGTTYYSLVGLHGFHVTAGLLMLVIVLFFGFLGRVGPEQSARVEVLSMYWHFVDAVWVVVFTVVYVLGR